MSNSPPRPFSKTPHLPPSSPKRLPLHQRSESQANSSTPTIRFVTDSSSDVYGKSPFPTQPSQILLPRYAPSLSRDLRVSNSDENVNYASAKPTKHEAVFPRPPQSRKSNRVSTSTTTSDVDTSFDTYGSALSFSSTRLSSKNSPPTSLFADEDGDRFSYRLPPVLEKIASKQTPLTSKSTIRPVIPSATNVHVQDVVKQLETTLATSSQSDRPISSASSRRLSQPVSSTSLKNYLVFPNSSQASLPTTSSASNSESADQSDDTLQLSSATKLRNQQKRLSSPPKSTPKSTPRSPPKTPQHADRQYSHESLAFSDASYSTNVDRPRSASSPASPAHAVRAAILTGAKLQYSTVRAPSASGSWAEVSRPAAINPPRMHDGPFKQRVWSPRLSTIASESTRTTQSNSSSGLGYQPRRRTISSIASEGAQTSRGVSSEFEYGSGVLTGTDSNVSIPQPLFSPSKTDRPFPHTPRDTDTGRDSDEREDTLGELQAHPLRKQRSFLGRFAPSSRPGSAESGTSSQSQISFMGDLSWARRYYSGEQTTFARSGLDASTDSASSIRPDTATSGNTASPTSDTFPNAVWRPRTRPHEPPRNERLTRPWHTRDRAITEVSELETVVVSGQRSRAVSLSVNEMVYSPHLHRARRTTNRYSAWAAPSFEEPFVRSLLSPAGRQLFLFVLGFIMPPLWMIAAILPLPRKTTQRADADAVPNSAQASEFESQAYPNSLVPTEVSIEEKRWQKAKWWRTVNRVMSILGLLIIGAVVALAIIGTRHGLG